MSESECYGQSSGWKLSDVSGSLEQDLELFSSLWCLQTLSRASREAERL